MALWYYEINHEKSLEVVDAGVSRIEAFPATARWRHKQLSYDCAGLLIKQITRNEYYAVFEIAEFYEQHRFMRTKAFFDVERNGLNSF